VYKGKVSYTKKLFWFININVTLTNRSFNNPSAVNLPYDRYPGGRFELFGQINSIDIFNDDDGNFTQFQADLLNALVGSANINFNTEDTFGFIPTPSALDIGGSLGIPLDDDYYYFYKYNINKPQGFPFDPPFDNYTTSFTPGGENEEHISFNQRNGDWLASELDTISNNEQLFDCTYECEPSTIYGNSTICSSRSYSLSVVSSNYNWVVSQSGNIVSVSGNGTPNLTLTRNGNSSGLVTLSIVPDGACGQSSFTATKTIWVGLPEAEVSGSDPRLDLNPTIYEHQDVVIYMQPIGDLYTLNSSNMEIDFGTNTDFDFHGIFGDAVSMSCISSLPYLNLIFDVRIKNECGWGPWRNITYFLNGHCPSCSNGWNFMVASNPSTSNFEVLIENESNIQSTSKKHDNSLARTNANQNEKSSEHASKQTFSISIANIYGSTIHQTYNTTDRKN